MFKLIKTDGTEIYINLNDVSALEQKTAYKDSRPRVYLISGMQFLITEDSYQTLLEELLRD